MKSSFPLRRRVVLFIAAALVSGCAAAPTPTTAPTAPPQAATATTVNTPEATVAPTVVAATPTAAAGTFPLTLQNCGASVTFDKAPERVVTLYPPASEIMLALGLKDKIIGAAATAEGIVLPEYAADYKAMRSISTSSKVPKEILIAERPDLVIDNQPDYFYDPAEGFASREDLAKAGAKTYTLEAKCGGGKKDATIDDVYADLRNLGKLFGVSERAERVIAEMQQRIDTTQAKIKGRPAVKVMFYDAGESPLGMFGPGAWEYALKLAGGVNVFADLKESYAQLSIEEVAARDSDVIIVAGYQAEGVKSSEERVAFIKQAFPNNSAVKNNRVVIVPYEYTNPGLQNALGVEAFARAFHPEAFAGAAPATAGTKTAYPLTIENCGRTLTFNKAPERVLATYQNVAEILVTLGLADKIVGVTYGQAYEPPKDIAAQVNALNYLSPRGKGSAVKETTLATNPDFVFAAYVAYDFDASRGLASQAEFETAGAPIYGVSAECAKVSTGITVEMIYSDIINIGKIFDVEARAQSVVQSMRDRIAAVQSKVANEKPLSVAFYDAGEDQLGFYGSGLNADMIRLAGGANVFADRPESYVQVSQEVFASQSPDIFAVIDYEGSPSAPSEEQTRADFLFKTFPNMPAAKSKRWVPVSGAAFAAGVRIPDAIETMARAFHPNAFK